MTPSPQPGLRAHKGTLWVPVAKIAGAQVAGNSNLKLGDTPRTPVNGVGQVSLAQNLSSCLAQRNVLAIFS